MLEWHENEPASPLSNPTVLLSDVGSFKAMFEYTRQCQGDRNALALVLVDDGGQGVNEWKESRSVKVGARRHEARRP